MILLRGITGFCDEQETVDGAQFKSICFYVITKNGGKVLSFNEPEIATNYYKVKVDVFDEQLYIVLNLYYPFLAFASSLEYGSIQFMDHQQLGKEFGSFYKVLTAHELHEPLVISNHKGRRMVENPHDLGENELQQLWYWRPQIVGDVMFNIWD